MRSRARWKTSSMNRRSRAIRFLPAATLCWRRGPLTRCARPRLPFLAPVMSVFSSATASRARRARSRPSMRASCAGCARAGGGPGGELTVRIGGKGGGGPNQEYALALAIALDGMPAVAAIAADTDGTDGGAGSPLDPAGALIDGGSIARAKTNGLDPAAFLTENNSSVFFEALGDLLAPGPTYTNVNDFRAIIVDRP